MQTPAQSDRAIVLPLTVDLRNCTCGCEGMNGDCTVTKTGSTDEPQWSETMRLTLAPDIKPNTIVEAVQQGLIVDSILKDAAERKAAVAGIDKAVKELVTLAEDQGFTVIQDGSSLKWTNPEGGTVSTPTRVIGRGLQNIKAQLRRLGLDIPRTGKATDNEATTDVIDLDAEPEPEPTQPPDVVAAFAALATLSDFIGAHQRDDGEEWQSICEGLEAELAAARAERDQAIAERDELRSKLDTVRSLFAS